MAFLSISDALCAWAKGGGIEVDFDWTIFGQIAIFLVLFFTLKPLLFEPMLKLFEDRERRIEGARKRARDIDDKSAGALTAYEAAMTLARAEGNVERERLRAEGVAQETALLSMVRLETLRQTEEGRKVADEETARVRSALGHEVPKIARDLASRVLGREVTS